MSVPFTFATASGNIALSKLDSNFNTPITIGNTSVLLGNTITTLNNMTLANVTITSGTSVVTNVIVTDLTVTNLTATLANVTISNVANLYATSSNLVSASIGNLTLSNALSVPNGGTGLVTIPANNVLLGNGVGSISSVSPGTSGNVLTSIGGAWVSNAAVGGGGGTPGGANTTIQYNNTGSFNGSANLTFNGTTLNAASINVSTGNLTFTTTAQRFVGDFTNTTISSRTNFVTGTANSSTGIYALPSGTSTAASWQATNSSDPTNASKVLISTNGTTDVQIVSGVNGTGTYLPLTFFNGGLGRFVIGTSGQFGVGPTATVSYGTSGQAFVSGGSSVAPAWGTLPVAGGGTGLTTIPAGNVVIGNGTSALYGISPGTSGNVLTSIGGVWTSNASVSTSTPGGSTTQVQFNNSGSFAGDANLTFSGSTLTSANLIVSNLTASQAIFSSSTKQLVSNPITGSGSVVMNSSPIITSPSLITPALGSPTSGNMAATTNIPVANATGTLAVANGGTGVTSSTGSGSNVLNTSPTISTAVLVSPALGTPTSGSLVATTNIPVANATGTLAVGNGGTGVTTIPAGNVVIGNGTSSLYGVAPGTAGNVLTSIGGAWVSNAVVSGGGSPGGSTTQFQYNNAGSFAGAANLTTDGANVTVGSANTLRFANLTSATYVGFKANAIVAANVTWTLPTTDGTSGQLLSTNGSGTLSWSSTLPAVSPLSVEYLVVAGGGGGGTYVSGGGGAGGLLTTSGYAVATGTSYTVTVGAGGAAKSNTTGIGNSGSNSVFGVGTVINSAATSGSITSVGGGGGATGGGVAGSATTGGSGGGGGSSSATGGAAGTSGQGNSGGNSPGASGNYPSGGGGGASAAGGTPATNTSPGGNGGAGNTYTTGTSITGLADSYAGGGGGATIGTAGTGGTGGGGNGTVYNSSAIVVTNGTAGTINTGGGSGGGGVSAGSVGTSLAGGSGVVMIAYPSSSADLAFIGLGLTTQSWNGSAWVNNAAGSTTPNTSIRSGYKVYRFSAGTGTIYW